MATTLNTSFTVIGKGFCISAFGEYSYTGNCSARCYLTEIALSMATDNNNSAPCTWFAIGI